MLKNFVTYPWEVLPIYVIFNVSCIIKFPFFSAGTPNTKVVHAWKHFILYSSHLQPII